MEHHYVMFSAGEGSFRTALIARRRNPDAYFRLLFVDTLYEDADAYRFLVEGAALVLGRELPWSVQADAFPDYRVPIDTPMEDYRGNPEWRAYLADLRERTAVALPELIWLVEGRDPWEIFRDERFLGNSRRDPCSKIAKRRVADAWRRQNSDPYSSPHYFAVGIGDHEAHRFEGNGRTAGLGPRMAADGWLYHAPLLTEPAAGEESHFFAPLDALGVAPPRLYGMGYQHNNCGGFCCKAGQAHWANRLRVQPERYVYDMAMERKLAAYLGKNVSMLTDRRGGGKRPLTLAEFADRLAADPTMQIEMQPGESGCGCMIEV